LKGKEVGLPDHRVVCVYVCVSRFEFFNQFTDFHEMWRKNYVIEENPNPVIFNFLETEITIWWTHELVRWMLSCRGYYGIIIFLKDSDLCL
jgi:hypothetical protein